MLNPVTYSRWEFLQQLAQLALNLTLLHSCCSQLSNLLTIVGAIYTVSLVDLLRETQAEQWRSGQDQMTYNGQKQQDESPCNQKNVWTCHQENVYRYIKSCQPSTDIQLSHCLSGSSFSEWNILPERRPGHNLQMLGWDSSPQESVSILGDHL